MVRDRKEQEERSALMRLLQEGSDADVRRFFILLTPPMLADCLESLPEEEDRVRVVRLMSAPLAAEVLREVDASDRDEILEELSDKRIAEVTAESKSDDAADLVGSLPPERQERVLDELEDEDREEIEELLSYGEETAGGIMQTEFVSVVSDLTVGQAIEAVREADIGDVGEIHEVFVVDAQKRLVGVVSPADLLHEETGAALRAVMDASPIKAVVSEDQEQIARRAREHDLATIPVVDDAGVLVGQVLHDDIADVIQEEATEDIAKLAGADPEELRESVWYAVRTRAVWLAPAFCGGLVVAFYLASVEADLKQAPLLIAFLPIILGMAGNVGTQTSALTVRALALGRVDHDRTLKVIGRQFATGL
ncbi:MAG: magnesium transporter, partial [Planctomycetota bacterium]|nr:magnesium transporter [Planctomycetota bacterium]